LQELEREVERQWWWLQGALNAVAQVRADGSPEGARSFRRMQAQAREVDRRGVQIALRIAELEGDLNDHD
jgi:hypothetical protein